MKDHEELELRNTPVRLRKIVDCNQNGALAVDVIEFSAVAMLGLSRCRHRLAALRLCGVSVHLLTCNPRDLTTLRLESGSGFASRLWHRMILDATDMEGRSLTQGEPHWPPMRACHGAQSSAVQYFRAHPEHDQRANGHTESVARGRQQRLPSPAPSQR